MRYFRMGLLALITLLICAMGVKGNEGAERALCGVSLILQEDSFSQDTVGTLLMFMLGLAAAVAVILMALCRPILNGLNCPEVGRSEAAAYMLITLAGTPFVFGYNAVVGKLRGMGEPKRPLYFIIVAAVINIVLDVLLVAVFQMGAAGTAIATIASQLGSFLASFLFLYRRKDQFDFELKLSYFKIDFHILKIIIRLGIPQVVRSLFVRFGML